MRIVDHKMEMIRHETLRCNANAITGQSLSLNSVSIR